MTTETHTETGTRVLSTLCPLGALLRHHSGADKSIQGCLRLDSSPRAHRGVPHTYTYAPTHLCVRMSVTQRQAQGCV